MWLLQLVTNQWKKHRLPFHDDFINWDSPIKLYSQIHDPSCLVSTIMTQDVSISFHDFCVYYSVHIIIKGL